MASPLTIQTASDLFEIISNAPDTNYSTNTQLLLGFVAGSLGRGVGIWDFSALPDGVAISAATGSIYLGVIAALAIGEAINIDRVVRTDVVLSQDTYNSYKTGSTWSTAGCGDSTNDYTTSGEATANIPASAAWVDFDLLTMVQYAQANTSKKLYFRVVKPVETNLHYVIGNSSYYSADTSLRPKLVITYSSGAYELDCAPGSYSITGSNLTPLAARMINTGPGSYVISGANLTPLAARMMNAAPGSYTITGADAGVVAGRVLSADPGSYDITGANLTPLAARVLNAAPGVYNILGFDATLAYSGAPAGGGHYIPLPRRMIRKASRVPFFKY